MKRFFKVRLLPICLLLVMLLQSLPVLAQREFTLHLGMRYAAESKTYGTIAPDFSVSYLYYDQLETDAQRALYTALAEAKPGDNIIALEVTDIPTIIVPPEGATAAFQAEIMAYVESQVLPAYAAATLDNPLMFWASGVMYGANLSVTGNTVSSITIQCLPDASGNYNRAGYEAAVEALWDVYYSLSIPEDNTYLQLKYFHDYLCETVVYVESKNSHNVTGPLLEGKSVCEGYAKSFKLFCQVMEIPCVTITGVGYGSNGSEPHAWNAVRMEDGKWYAVDVTWDDQTSGIFYDYFLVGGESVPEYFKAIPFNQSHVAMGDFYGTGQVVLELPALNPTAYVPPASHEHEYVSVVTPSTCTKYGFTTYTCSCGDSYVGDYTPLADHAYTETVYLPTCEEEGYTAYLCVDCGDTSIDHVTPALGHEYDGGVITVQPTEEAEGEIIYTCLLCGDAYSESLPVLEHTHKYTEEITPPTCTEDGFTTYTCKCGDSYTDNYLPANGHGYSVERMDPTCERDGYILYECFFCDYSTEEIYPATGHLWDNGVITLYPTEFSEGEKVYTCGSCGKTYTEILPRLEHFHDFVTEVTPPTCAEEGYTTYSCYCGMFYINDYLPATGHNYVEDSREPTCEEDGYKSSFCEYCGEGGSEIIPAFGHNFSDWYNTAPGVEERTCIYCGKTETREHIPYEYIIENGKVTITEYTGSGGDVIIPDTIEGFPVVSIDLFAFFSCTSMTSIKLPDSVTSIKSAAFASCESLTSFVIPDGVTVIEQSTFSGCFSLTSIVIPDNVTSIGDWSFHSCHSLTSIIFESPDTEIYDDPDTIYDTATIYGYAGSTAQAYAEKYGRKFVEIKDVDETFDVSGDGVVDQSDATLLLSLLVGNTDSETLFDFDFDGKLTIYDCVLLLQQIKG